MPYFLLEFVLFQLWQIPQLTLASAKGGVGDYFDLFIYLVMLRGTWDLSSPTRDRSRAPCIGSVES